MVGEARGQLWRERRTKSRTGAQGVGVSGGFNCVQFCVRGGRGRGGR